jgi:hypothetical protein
MKKRRNQAILFLGSMQKFGHDTCSHPPSRISKGTLICWRMTWPLNKRMLYEQTKLDNKHRTAQEKSLSLSLSLSTMATWTALCMQSVKVGSTLYCLGVHGWEISYHPWCRGHLSSLSSTFVLIGHFHVESNFIIKPWEHKISSFEQNLKSLDYELITNQAQCSA